MYFTVSIVCAKRGGGERAIRVHGAFMYGVNCVHAFGRVERQVQVCSCASMAHVINPWHM